MQPPCSVVAGEEPTVTARGRGNGGRCQEFALVAALERDERKGTIVPATSTDNPTGPAMGALSDDSG